MTLTLRFLLFVSSACKWKVETRTEKRNMQNTSCNKYRTGKHFVPNTCFRNNCKKLSQHMQQHNRPTLTEPCCYDQIKVLEECVNGIAFILHTVPLKWNAKCCEGRYQHHYLHGDEKRQKKLAKVNGENQSIMQKYQGGSCFEYELVG